MSNFVTPFRKSAVVWRDAQTDPPTSSGFYAVVCEDDYHVELAYFSMFPTGAWNWSDACPPINAVKRCAEVAGLTLIEAIKKLLKDKRVGLSEKQTEEIKYFLDVRISEEMEAMVAEVSLQGDELPVKWWCALPDVPDEENEEAYAKIGALEAAELILPHLSQALATIARNHGRIT